MSSGWVAIPQAAIAAARRDGRLAVLDLYETADRTGYAPRPWTERQLAEEWGVGRDVVRRILLSLEAAGLITVERAEAGSRKPSVLTVLPATYQTRNQTRDQNDHAPSPNIEHDQPPTQPDAEPARAESPRAHRPDQTRPDVTTSPLPPPPPAAGEPSGRARWVSDRAVADLAALVEHEAADPEPVLERWSQAQGGTVDAWLARARPRKVQTLQGTSTRRDWPDAPAGLRQRDVAEGLRLAVERWRAGDRGPPTRTATATPPPPTDDGDPECSPRPTPESASPGSTAEPASGSSTRPSRPRPASAADRTAPGRPSAGPAPGGR